MAKSTKGGLTVKTRLIGLSVIVICALIFIMLYVRDTNSRIKRTVQIIHLNDSTLIRSNAAFREGAYKLEGQVYDYLSRPDSARRKSAFSTLKKTLGEYNSTMAALLTVTPNEKEANDALSEVAIASTEFTASLDQFISDLGDGGEMNSKAELQISAIQGAFATLMTTAEKFETILSSESDRSFASAGSLIRNSTLAFLSTATAIMIILSIMLYSVMRSITKPLGQLYVLIDKVGSGDLSQSSKTAVRKNDEIGQMAAKLDDLVVKLRVLVSSVKVRLDALSETGDSLSATMTQTSASVTQINSNLASSGKMLNDQSSSVEEVSAAIEELARSIDALSLQIQNQSDVVTQSSAAVEEIIATIDSVNNNAANAAEAADRLKTESSSGKSRIDEVGQAVDAIVLSSENLGEAASLITEIAQRTNLLAMNAAIEAAHAGDAGKGFAVVASEIQRLAEESNDQARVISDDLINVAESIESVKTAADAAVSSFASILEKAEALDGAVASIDSSMAEQKAGGRQVLESLTKLREITSEIKAGSGEMAAGNSSMLSQVSTLKGITQTVVQNNAEILLGTKEINDAMVGTTELATRNESNITGVSEALEKFKL